MADSAQEFSPVYPLDGASVFPSSDQIQLSVVTGLELVQLFANKGKSSKLCKQIGIDRGPGRATVRPEFTALPVSPRQWMLMSAASTHADGLASHVSNLIENRGYVSEQSDSRVCIRLRGSMARRVMAKGCRLDLHPSAGGAGFCAQTVMAQVGVTIHQIDDIPTFDLLVYSGFARSFWDWITEAAAEFSK